MWRNSVLLQEARNIKCTVSSSTSRCSVWDCCNCLAFSAMSVTVEHSAAAFRSAMQLSSCLQSATSTVEQWHCVSRRRFWETLCRARALGCAFPLVSYNRRCQFNITELQSFSICNNQPLSLNDLYRLLQYSDNKSHVLPRQEYLNVHLISYNHSILAKMVHTAEI